MSGTEKKPARTPRSARYEALRQAETGSFPDPWIRTVGVPGESSSAFGPVQITYTKMKDYAERGLLSPESVKFFREVMEPMYLTMLKYGREPKKPGYDPAYDYGGTGKFDVAAYGDSYDKVAEEMINYDASRAKDDIGFIRSWRGTGDDARYNKVVLSELLRRRAAEQPNTQK